MPGSRRSHIVGAARGPRCANLPAPLPHMHLQRLIASVVALALAGCGDGTGPVRAIGILVVAREYFDGSSGTSYPKRQALVLPAGSEKREIPLRELQLEPYSL